CLFVNATPSTALYTLSLHDALPISRPFVIQPCAAFDRAILIPQAQTSGCRQMRAAVVVTGLLRPRALAGETGFALQQQRLRGAEAQFEGEILRRDARAVTAFRAP